MPVAATDRLAVRPIRVRRRSPSGRRLTPDGLNHPVMRWGQTPTAERDQGRGDAAAGLDDGARLGRPAPHPRCDERRRRRAASAVAVQRYGYGRTMVFAGEASWRWRMRLPSKDLTFETFWRQAGRWLVASAPEPVALSVPAVSVGEAATLSIDVRDGGFRPLPDATVRLRVTRGGATQELLATPDATRPGRFTAPVPADQPGLLRVDVEARREGAPVGEAHEWALVGGADREWADPRRNDGVLAGWREGRRPARRRERHRRAATLTRPRGGRRRAAPPEAPSCGIRPGCWWGCSPLGGEWILRRRWGYDRNMRIAVAPPAFALAVILAAAPAVAAERYAIIITARPAARARHPARHLARQPGHRLRGSMRMPAITSASRRLVAERKAQRTVADDVDISSRNHVRAAFTRLAPVLEKDDLLLVVLIGHATFDGVDAKFNLVGAISRPPSGKRWSHRSAARSLSSTPRGRARRSCRAWPASGASSSPPPQCVRATAGVPALLRAGLGEPRPISQGFAHLGVGAVRPGQPGVRQHYRSAASSRSRSRGSTTTATASAGLWRPVRTDDRQPHLLRRRRRPSGPAVPLSELVARRNSLESELDELKSAGLHAGGDYDKRATRSSSRSPASRAISHRQAGRS